MKVERTPVEEHVYMVTLTPDEAREIHAALEVTSNMPHCLHQLRGVLVAACRDQLRRFW